MSYEVNTQIIKELLDKSTLQLAPATLAKLRSARTAALDQQRTQSTLPVLSWIGHHGSGRESFHFSKVTSWAIAVLFITFLISGTTYWQNYSVEHEICEADIALLTDELPLHVFVD